MHPDMDIFAIPVHPAADKFLMLDEDELDELSADIKAHGLLQPLVVQEIEGVLTLIDGRNRLEACRRAGVEPHYNLLDEQDAVAYIISANINRRHLTVGQRAMMIALLYPEPEKGGRGRNSSLSKGFLLEASGTRLSQARTVLRYAADLIDPVRSGAMPLNKAYEEARARKDHATHAQSQLATLRAEAPDLATRVEEGELALTDANRQLAEREQRAETNRLGKFLMLNAAISFANSYKDYGGDFSDLSGHWDEFSSATRYKRSQLILALSDLHKNLPDIISALERSED